ncbi:MAG: hypothetical protein GY866_14240 [Proteobacteria bacterium]|nr:hypothetical protein [Pseudomonadota bacterium]
MGNTMDGSNPTFKNHKIIASESKSWFVGKPGSGQNSYSVTWSPGALVMYGEMGNITLIYSGFDWYEKAKKWMSDCSLDDFKSVVAHDIPENLEYYHEAMKFWGREPHYK